MPATLDPAPHARASRDWATHAALIVVQMAFAAGAVEGKLAMSPTESGGGQVDPFALAMARMVGAAAFFHGVAALTGARVRIGIRDQFQLAGLSGLGIVLNQALFLYGLKLTAAFSAALLSATIPVFTAALAVLLRRERASARTAVGLVLALSGVLWLTGIRSLDWGAVVIALNCFAYSLYLVFSLRIIRRLGAMTVITWLFTWGTILFAPWARLRSRQVVSPGALARGCSSRSSSPYRPSLRTSPTLGRSGDRRRLWSRSTSIYSRCSPRSCSGPSEDRALARAWSWPLC